MSTQLETVKPPNFVSLLIRARERFRAVIPQKRASKAMVMRDLLAQSGLDINGRPLGSRLSSAPHNKKPAKRSAKRVTPAAAANDLFAMEFSYRGRDGQLTHRLVSVWVSDSEYFAGHCHLRDSHRLFSWAKVVGQVRLSDTGEKAEASVICERFA